MIALMTSCASGKIVLSNDANISKYKYVIFGKETSGDRELDDVVKIGRASCRERV